MAGNLMSYILLEKTGKTPEEFAKEEVFKHLGIKDNYYEWYVNLEQVQTSFHGLKMTTTALSKLGLLYLQNGMVNNNKQIVDPSWIERSFTVGDTEAKEKVSTDWSRSHLIFVEDLSHYNHADLLFILTASFVGQTC